MIFKTVFSSDFRFMASKIEKENDKIALNKSTQKYRYFSYFSMKRCCGYSLEAPRIGTSNEY